MRFYSNENFPLLVVQLLREFGHDVLTSFDAGQANQSIPDDEVLNFAIKEKRAVITLNRKDFIKLHKENGIHCGIVVCKVDADYNAQANRIDKILRSYDRLDNELIRVNRS